MAMTQGGICKKDSKEKNRKFTRNRLAYIETQNPEASGSKWMWLGGNWEIPTNTPGPMPWPMPGPSYLLGTLDFNYLATYLVATQDFHIAHRKRREKLLEGVSVAD
jgi:hypothetical protein